MPFSYDEIRRFHVIPTPKILAGAEYFFSDIFENYVVGSTVLAFCFVFHKMTLIQNIANFECMPHEQEMCWELG